MHLPIFFDDAESTTPDFIPLENDLFEKDEEPSIDIAIKAYKEIVCEVSELRLQQKKLLELKAETKRKVVAFDKAAHALEELLEYQEDNAEVYMALRALRNIDYKSILSVGHAMSKAASSKARECRLKMEILQSSLDDIHVEQDTTHLHQCPICYEKKICRVFNPCGHTSCDDCVQRIDRGSCYMCRMPITSIIKIYTN
jgi:hypothetical protein